MLIFEAEIGLSGLEPGAKHLLPCPHLSRKRQHFLNQYDFEGLESYFEAEIIHHSVRTSSARLHRAEWLPFATGNNGPIHRIHQDPTGRARRPRANGYYRGSRHRGAARPADCGLREERSLVGAAVARSAVHPHSSEFHLGHLHSLRF